MILSKPQTKIIRKSSVCVCMCVCVCAQLCLTLCLSGSSVNGIFPGKDTGVGCHFLLQGIFPTQESNPGLLHCKQILYRLSYMGRPIFYAPLKTTTTTKSLGFRITTYIVMISTEIEYEIGEKWSFYYFR